MTPKRSITEILKDADKAKSFGELHQLFNEIMLNKGQYTPAELSFAKEYFEELGVTVENIPPYHIGVTWTEIPKLAGEFSPTMMVGRGEMIIPRSTWIDRYSPAQLKNMLSEKPSFWSRVKQAWKILIGK
jgi:hypothetical protein